MADQPNHTPGQHIPATPNLQIPIIDQDSPTLAPMHDEDISTHTLLLDQNIPTLTHNINQNVLDEDFSTLIYKVDEGIFSFQNEIPPTHGISDHYMLSHAMRTNPKGMEEKALMKEKASTAMEELTRLLRLTEPFWSTSSIDGKFILQRAAYEHMFKKTSHLPRPYTRRESSKYSQEVNISRAQLIDIFLNSEKWVDMFSTIVRKAQTLYVFESGSSNTQDGALQLMNAEMHILSPLVPTREFVFLRYCKQIGEGAWAITDVSIDSSKHNTTLPLAWRLPSGCTIHEISNESCMVSWIEHVEVVDQIQTGHLFREAICKNNSYGAEKWILTLERMCERTTLEKMHSFNNGGVIKLAEGVRSVMQLSHRMVKNFCENLATLSNIDTTQDRVAVSVLNSQEPGIPNETGFLHQLINIAPSIWLPISPQDVFNYFIDNSKRDPWDFLCNANPVHEIQRISNGTHPGNCTSILRPFIPQENILILQESYINSLESMIVYAPINVEMLNVAIRGEDSSLLRLLSSGFTIVGDGLENSTKGQGSLLTIAFQLLANSVSSTGQVDMVSLTKAQTLMTYMVKKIKAALNCPDMD